MRGEIAVVLLLMIRRALALATPKLPRALLAGAGISLALAFPSHASEELMAAEEAFEDYRYAAGLFHVRKAAEAGDRGARRTLGLMLLSGEALYGPEIPANRDEALRWLRLAAAEGCAISKHVLGKVEGPGAVSGQAGGRARSM